MFIGGAEVAAAVSVPSPLSVPTAIVGAGNVLYGFSDVFEGISVLTGNGSINFGRDLLFDGDQKKWDAAGAVLDISGFALTGASTGWGKAAKAGMASAPEVLRSIATQLGKMYLSASAGSVAGSYVEGAVTSVAGEDWGRGAGLITRFGVGGATYGGLSYADQSLNISGIYGVEAFDPAVLGAAEATAQNSANPYKLKPTHMQTLSNKQLNELIVSIEENGIRTSIKYVEFNGNMYVVDGHHRLIAAKHLGLSSVPIEQVTLPYLGYSTSDDLFW